MWKKGKLCLDLDLFKDLGWALDRDPPNLSEFRNILQKKTSEKLKTCDLQTPVHSAEFQVIIYTDWFSLYSWVIKT